MLDARAAARSRSRRDIALLVAVTAFYFIAGRLGLAIAFVHSSATAVWPPAGIALAALLGIGYRMWPAVFVGAFLVNVTTAGSVPASLGIAFGNTLEAVVGAYLVRRWAGGADAFSRPLNVLGFAVLAAMLSTTVSATIGVSTLCMSGLASWSRAGPIWWTWWLGDAVGDLVVAPALLLLKRRSRSLGLEAAALAAVLLLVGLVVFGGWLPGVHRHAPLEFLCIPPLLWAAFRFGGRETAFATVLLSGIAIWGTLRGLGPFRQDSENQSLLLLQAYMGVVALMGLAVAAVVERQRESEQLLRLTNRGLEAARLDAEEANRLKDRFLATLSHELRTPLNAINGWAHMLLTGTLGEDESRRAAEVIHRNAERQNRLISDMLDMSRILSGRLSLTSTAVRLDNVLQAALDTMRPLAQAREVHLEPAAEVGVVIHGDSGRLQQVFCNLLANAIKFAPPKRGAVALAVRIEGSHAEVSIEDNGPGIPASFVPHLFERFRQADPSTTRPHGGLGLGLAIAKELVDLHHGAVFGANRVDTPGAIFTVRLPLAATPLHDTKPPSAPTPSTDLSDVHILVVDDEVDALDVVANTLRHYGATVTTARSAGEAFASLRAHKPDMLVTDIAMPDEDGYSLLRRVRALSEHEGGLMPAAAVTAHASAADRRLALASGFRAHVAKPVQTQELLDVITELKRGRVPPRASAR